MEIRTLKYFLAVAREENMSRAAAQLHVTQPTLSKALKALEDELGKKLFTRHSFSISLTDEGVLLRSRAEDLVSMFAREGLGVLLTLNDLVDTSPGSGLVFRPLYPRLEMKMYLIWNRYPSFTPIAARFLRQIRSSFGGA
ncbi:MAG: LysR family transcriptional regulator [Oscillospiraceae bacterium]|nr:LysR family transcriptional regulator [Oscillospiraceae bacterium]